MAILIQQVLDDFLSDKNKNRKSKAKSFWVSSAGTCFRKRYFQRTNVKAFNSMPATTLRKFYVGDTFHKIIQDLVRKQAKYFEIEKRVENKDISGYIDIIAPLNGEKVLYELKTCSDFYFKYLDKMKYGCNINHIAQALTYYMLLKEKPAEIRIVYIGTSTLRIKECSAPITKKSLKWVKDDWAKCIKYYKDKMLPPKTKDKNQCSYCQYRKYCKNLKEVKNK